MLLIRNYNFQLSFSEGYESLARARREPTSISAYQERSVLGMEWESSDVTNPGAPSSILPETSVATSSSDATTVEISSNGDDAFDMFAEDDEHAIAKPSEGSNVISGPNSYCISSPSSNNLNNYSESKLCNVDFGKLTYWHSNCLIILFYIFPDGVLQNDYVFDESSGYSLSLSPPSQILCVLPSVCICNTLLLDNDLSHNRYTVVIYSK